MKKPLISIILISYKNYRYIYEALDSILCQDYLNIEIIISNDGSDDFDQKSVNQYLTKNKKQNIKNFIINNNKKNIGTVKNVNKAIKLSKGKYITIFAADDTLYNSQVVTKFINSFNTLPKNELIVTSQVDMYDVRLKKIIQPFISETNKEKIRKLTPKKLFAEMSTQCILPGSGTCYKREIFKKYGYFDEKYVLVEDYSSALRLSRLGVKYNYFDFISIKHRDGGISHGNIIGDTSAISKYDLDIFNIFKFEVLPYLNLLNERQKKEFIKKYKDIEWKYSYNYKYKNGTKIQRRKFVIENFNIISYSFFKNIFNDISDQVKGKKFMLFLIGLILLTIYSFNVDFGSSFFSIFSIEKNPDWSNSINKTIGFLGLFIVTLSITMTIFLFSKKYAIQIYKFIKFIF
ncbi:MAG: glycosyltransferase [Candidatus Shapirobacteria bacterium]|jgi:GT2 family glycosyltransferase